MSENNNLTHDDCLNFIKDSIDDPDLIESQGCCTSCGQSDLDMEGDEEGAKCKNCGQENLHGILVLIENYDEYLN